MVVWWVGVSSHLPSFPLHPPHHLLPLVFAGLMSPWLSHALSWPVAGWSGTPSTPHAPSLRLTSRLSPPHRSVENPASSYLFPFILFYVSVSSHVLPPLFSSSSSCFLFPLYLSLLLHFLCLSLFLLCLFFLLLHLLLYPSLLLTLPPLSPVLFLLLFLLISFSSSSIYPSYYSHTQHHTPTPHASSHPQQVRVWLAQLLEEEKAPLSSEKVCVMEQVYNMSKRLNSEIRFRWLRLGLKARWEESVGPALDFVTEQGRMKFVRPIYR